jgi:energy-converting hydrogenase Eha subunit A
MYITIKGIDNTQELSEKLKDVCRIKKVKDRQIVLTYNRKNFVIKPDKVSRNGFDVDLTLPTGLLALGAALGVTVSIVTGLTGFIPTFIFIVVALLIIQLIYKAANDAELKKFVALLSDRMDGKLNDREETITK